MAGTVYSLRIYAAGSLTPASGVVGPIVPAGLVYIVRDIDLVGLGGTAPAAIEIFNQVGGLLEYVDRSLMNVNGGYSWRGRQVFNEGEQVKFQVLVGTIDIAVSGYQLTLP